MPYICFSELDGFSPGNCSSPVRRQAITWANADLLSIRCLGTNFSEILIEVRTSSVREMHLKLSSAKMAAILSRGWWIKACRHIYVPVKWNIFGPFNAIGWFGYGLLSIVLLTHWGRDKMVAISQTTLSNPFSWTKIFEFRLKFHWSLFLRFQLTIFQHWFR